MLWSAGDGTVWASVNNSDPIQQTGFSCNGAGNVAIGGLVDGVVSAFVGEIREVALYNRVLTEEERLFYFFGAWLTFI